MKLKNLLNIPLLLCSFIGIQGLTAQEYAPCVNERVVSHDYYELEYSEVHEQALWVFYVLHEEDVAGGVKRNDHFRADPYVRTGSASLSDYVGSGYDRGHLCPAGSMKSSRDAMDESFYMSNMSPQVPGFNRGKWKELEELVRSWVMLEGELQVVTGPIFENNLGTIGSNEVTVPGYFYKVIYDPTDREKMIAFILPNERIIRSLENYVVSVDEVERRTGLDFFCNLSDVTEDRLEGKTWKTSWSFNANANFFHASENRSDETEETKPAKGKSQQCAAHTKSGSRCRRRVLGENYCWQHR